MDCGRHSVDPGRLSLEAGPTKIPTRGLRPDPRRQGIVQRRSTLFDEFGSDWAGWNVQQMTQKDPVSGDLAVSRIKSDVLKIDWDFGRNEQILPLRLFLPSSAADNRDRRPEQPKAVPKRRGRQSRRRESVEVNKGKDALTAGKQNAVEADKERRRETLPRITAIEHRIITHVIGDPDDQKPRQNRETKRD